MIDDTFKASVTGQQYQALIKTRNIEEVRANLNNVDWRYKESISEDSFLHMFVRFLNASCVGDAVRVMRQKDMSVDVVNAWGNTPLHTAVSRAYTRGRGGTHDSYDIVKCLLQAGSDIYRENHNGDCVNWFVFERTKAQADIRLINIFEKHCRMLKKPKRKR